MYINYKYMCCIITPWQNNMDKKNKQDFFCPC